MIMTKSGKFYPIERVKNSFTSSKFVFKLDYILII